MINLITSKDNIASIGNICGEFRSLPRDGAKQAEIALVGEPQELTLRAIRFERSENSLEI